MKDFLKGKKGIIMGVANNWSIAYGIAQFFHKCGVDDIVFTYPNDILKDRVYDLTNTLGYKSTFYCDVTDEKSVYDTLQKAGEKLEKIDFIIHSIAFANKNALRGEYYNTTKEDFLEAMEISCFSLTNVVKYAVPWMHEKSSIVTMSYYGAEKVMPYYNLMGVCKAALECSVKYLAHDIGREGMRINAISAGPIKTLAANGIKEFKNIFNWCNDNSPLGRSTTTQDVSGTAAYLVSDLSSGVTGTTLYVDSGYNIIGMKSSHSKKDI